MYVKPTSPTSPSSECSAPNDKLSDNQMSFPCVDLLADRQRALHSGPEPAYDRIVTGYETFQYDGEFHLDHGGKLKNFRLAYETWGKLAADRSNAILLHTGLSASSHARSHLKNPAPGWWEKFIGKPWMDCHR
jgi:homoserine acetyltransferase